VSAEKRESERTREQPSVEALIATVRLAREHLSEDEQATFDPALDSLTAALERAERAQVALGEELVTWMKKANAAEARAQKAEAALADQGIKAEHRGINIVNEIRGGEIPAPGGLPAALSDVRKAEQERDEEHVLRMASDEAARKYAAEAFSWQDAAQKAEAVVEAARAYKEHTEDQHFRRGHFNTSCPPLTRAMCTEYMELRRALTAYDEPPTEQIPGTGQVGC
jgi:hypothetical protein